MMMAPRSSSSDYYDPREGGQPVRVADLQLERGLREPARTNYFAVYRVDTGSGTVAADDVQSRFGAGSLLFFTPYQYLRFDVDEPVGGAVLNFHANVLCVETFHAEVGCSGALFNDPGGDPVLPVAASVYGELTELFSRIQTELSQQALAHTEAALSYLKVLLILATRSKAAVGSNCAINSPLRPPVLDELTALIEKHYRDWRSPAQYAKALCMTVKTLGRIVREQLGTTLTDLIRRRLLIHAKWQLLHTLRPIKEIAQELGFADELYFSRFFKKATGVSPTYFRSFETRIRGGSNLSMSSSHSSIQRPTDTMENQVIEPDERARPQARRRSKHRSKA